MILRSTSSFLLLYGRPLMIASAYASPMPFKVIRESLPAVLISIWAAAVFIPVAPALFLVAGATAWVLGAALLVSWPYARRGATARVITAAPASRRRSANMSLSLCAGSAQEVLPGRPIYEWHD